jgi:hypothetical protein
MINRHRFKVGDKVKRKKHDYPAGYYNGTYTVCETFGSHGIRLINNTNKRKLYNGYYAWDVTQVLSAREKIERMLHA